MVDSSSPFEVVFTYLCPDQYGFNNNSFKFISDFTSPGLVIEDAANADEV